MGRRDRKGVKRKYYLSETTRNGAESRTACLLYEAMLSADMSQYVLYSPIDIFLIKNFSVWIDIIITYKLDAVSNKLTP